MTSQGRTPADDGSSPLLVVVVPARNEVERVRACLGSLRRQHGRIKVFFSDNASDDGTVDVVSEFKGELDLVVRTTTLLTAAEHFVSAGRWALDAEPAGDFFALLAGDDTWSAGFAKAAVGTLVETPDVGALFPAFIWEEIGSERFLAPIAFRQQRPAARRWRALLLPDRRELANLIYGVHRRESFSDLLTAWERGGDHFAADYAAVWGVLGGHKVAGCSDAVGRRHVNQGADLLERVGLRRADARGLVGVALMYLRLNLRVNRLIAAALSRVVPDGRVPPLWSVQVTRAPQWLWGAVRQARDLRAGFATGKS